MSRSISTGQKIWQLIFYLIWLSLSLCFLFFNIKSDGLFLSRFVSDDYVYWVFTLIGFALHSFLLAFSFWGIISVFYLPSIFAPYNTVLNKTMTVFVFIPGIAAVLGIVGVFIYANIEVLRQQWGWLFLTIPATAVMGIIALAVVAAIYFPIIMMWQEDEDFHFWSFILCVFLSMLITAGVCFLIGSFYYLLCYHEMVAAIITFLLIVTIVSLFSVKGTREEIVEFVGTIIIRK